MSIKYSDNIKDYEKMLKRVHGGIAIAGAQTVNEAADIVESKYKSSLKSFILRNKFTLGAVKKYHSKPQNAAGDFRKIQNINSRVAVMKMKGGKDHYLLKQEDGGANRGSMQTKGKVAFPLDPARSGNNRSRPIKGPLQLQKAERIQSLTFSNGRPLGTTADGFSPRQRWGILSRYMKKENPFGWNLKKPFFFTGILSGLGIFQNVGNKIKMIRRLSKISVNIKATGKFQKSFEAIDNNKLGELMARNARKIAGIK
jgi:hypothetical protein